MDRILVLDLLVLFEACIQTPGRILYGLAHILREDANDTMRNVDYVFGLVREDCAPTISDPAERVCDLRGDMGKRTDDGAFVAHGAGLPHAPTNLHGSVKREYWRPLATPRAHRLACVLGDAALALLATCAALH